MEKVKYSLKATNVFLGKENSRIHEVAKKAGIVLPSTHTALFQSVYAPLETANDNGVRLATSTIADLPGLIGAQANLNHYGYGWIVGSILDAWVDEATQEINIIFSFAKNIYQDEYTMALEAMAEGKLTVSFELLADNADIETMADKTIRCKKVDYQGVGVLIGKSPAYKKAKVYEMAEVIKERAKNSGKEMLIAEKVLEKCDEILKSNTMDVTDPSMICNCPHCETQMTYDDTLYDADMNMYHKPCLHMGRITKPYHIKAENKSPHSEVKDEDNNQMNQGGQTMTEEQKTMVANIRAELAGYIPQDAKDEDLLVEVKVAEYRQAKSDADAKAKEAELAETSAKEAFEAEQKAKDEKLASLEKEVSDLKATVDAQKKEIEKFQAEDNARTEQAKAEKLAEIKAGLKDNEFCKEFKDEDYLDESKVSQAKMLKENAVLKAKVEALEKASKSEIKAEEKAEADLNTGSGENTIVEESPRKIIAKLGKQ